MIPRVDRIARRYLGASDVDIQLLTAPQMDNLLRDEYRDREKTNVPFVDTDDTDWRVRDQTRRGSYFVATIDGGIVGVRKFYHWENMKEDINRFLEAQGMPLVQGRVFNGAYVAVHPEFQRQGIGSRLNLAVMKMLHPGDVLILGSHEPDGKKLNQAWLGSRRGQVNILYGNRFTAYADYDPTKVNYVVSDASFTV